MRHLLGDADRVRVLPDPPSLSGRADVWWPPRALTPAWLREEAATFDVLHVHFGMESFTLDELRAALDALAETGRPLVYTAHDLENPQLVDQHEHEAHVALMLERAAAVVTLTHGAADEIRRRWHRTATVVPHPHVVPLDVPRPIGTPRQRPLVHAHLRDLRPNVDGVGCVAALAAAAALLAADGLEVDVLVHVNARVRDADQLAALRSTAAASTRVEVVTVDRMHDRALEAAVADADVEVLPYHHGTHSGWAELCFDLGVPVIAPHVGHLAEQHPHATVSTDLADPAGFADALRRAIGLGTSPGSPGRAAVVDQRRAARAAARDAITATQLAVYEEVVTCSAPRSR